MQIRSVKQQIREAQDNLANTKQSFTTAQGTKATYQERIDALSESLEKISLQISQSETKQKMLTGNITALLSPYNIPFDFTQIEKIELTLSQRWEKYDQSQKDLQLLKLNLLKAETALTSVTASLQERLIEQVTREKEWKQEMGFHNLNVEKKTNIVATLLRLLHQRSLHFRFSSSGNFNS